MDCVFAVEFIKEKLNETIKTYNQHWDRSQSTDNEEIQKLLSSDCILDTRDVWVECEVNYTAAIIQSGRRGNDELINFCR